MLPYLNSANLSFNNFECEVPLKGVFENSAAISVVGNLKLCGGVEALHLPACLNQKFTNRKKNHTMRNVAISAGVSVGLLLILPSVFCWRRKKLKELSPVSNAEDKFLRLSYSDIFKATEGFAQSNLIGVGNFSSVYKGVVELYEKPIAVKMLKLEVAGASKSFITECEALRITRHRNLLKIITACSSVNFKGEEFKAVVFNFMPNGSLDQWLHPNHDIELRKEKFDCRKRLNIAIDVASALDYLRHHCQPPIVHCDLKPSNILLDEEMTSHDGDFGLARLLTRNENNIGGDGSSIAIKGTIGYVPPKYGVGGQVSVQGDVYSCGILLLEMVTGKRPTDQMFTHNLSLRDYCKAAGPENVINIMDFNLLPNNDEKTDKSAYQTVEGSRVIECLTSLLRIGVACSAESPSERMNMKDVVMHLNTVKEVFLGYRCSLLKGSPE